MYGDQIRHRYLMHSLNHSHLYSEADSIYTCADVNRNAIRTSVYIQANKIMSEK